ncbi:MAG: ADP-ribosylglycohydrolase family protein [Pirellulaceae bacterium]|nr:ADP-ribosylglycohydrolase family protein [Pirellulaceae bacterium]
MRSTARSVEVAACLWIAALACMPPLATAAEPQFRRLPVKEYRDKMKAGWIGQIAGVAWGAPTEFKWREKIIPESDMPKWQPGMINNAFGQDDLYVDMTFLRSMEQYGLDVSIRQAGIDFANSGYPLWCANDAGRKNLRRGIAPPDSSHPQFNQCPNDIDYQIEADFSGLIAPGMPNTAIKLGEKFGRLMNYGDGVYGGQFMGAMYCEAFFETDPVSNPSSSGGVLFTTVGFSKLPERFNTGLNEKAVFSHTAYNFPALLDVCDKLARQSLVAAGGRIETDAAGEEDFVIPVVAPKPSALDLSWAPGPIANSRFTAEEMAKITVAATPAGWQKALDTFAPGWKLSDCGTDMDSGLRAEFGGKKNVFVSHPLNGNTGCKLSKKIEVDSICTGEPVR